MTDVLEAPPAEAVLFAKIAAVMAEVGYVEKRGWNDFQKYKYVTEADLVDAVRAKLAEREVALIPSVISVSERPYKTAKGKDSVVTTVLMAFTFVDGSTGATFRTEWAGQGDDLADKGLYSAMTGALKYFLMKTFLIPTGDDPEAKRESTSISEAAQIAAEVFQPQPSDDPTVDPAHANELMDAIVAKHMTTGGIKALFGEVGVAVTGPMLKSKEGLLDITSGLTVPQADELERLLKEMTT